MVALDEPLPTPDGTRTLLDLAACGALTLARTGCFREQPGEAPRAAWWALVGPGGSRYEISGTAFRALLRLGVPVARRSGTRQPASGKAAGLQIAG
jgi:hypothetical protein